MSRGYPPVTPATHSRHEADTAHLGVSDLKGRIGGLKSDTSRNGVLGAVLAGGRGSRLGGGKAGIQLSGRPLISYPLAAIAAAGLGAGVCAQPNEIPGFFFVSWATFGPPGGVSGAGGG